MPDVVFSIMQHRICQKKVDNFSSRLIDVSDRMQQRVINDATDQWRR